MEGGGGEGILVSLKSVTHRVGMTSLPNKHKPVSASLSLCFPLSLSLSLFQFFFFFISFTWTERAFQSGGISA